MSNGVFHIMFQSLLQGRNLFLKRKKIIDIHSPDAQLIADMLKHGYSYNRACD